MSAQTFIENHALMDGDAQSSLSTGSHKIPSREEWLKFKPIIQQLYIEENQTYPTVARELARRFDFYPTKRQFTRKTEEWGLKKNFRKAERKLLLQNDKKSGIVEFVLGDKRVSDPKRIQRLKRRYAHESPLPQVQLVTSYQSINVPPNSDVPYRSLEEQLPISDYMGEIATAHAGSTISNLTEENDAMDLDQWPLSWDIDVPGSPGLTRLFRLLEIEASMPPLNLDDEVVDKEETISGNELRNYVECHGATSSQLSTICSRAKYDCMPNTEVQPVPILGKGIPWSPLFELDLFPTSQNTRGYRRGMVLAASSGPLIDVWDKDIKEWKFKLRKFRKTLPDHNPAIILSLEHLVHLCRKRKEVCLSLLVRLLSARLKERCPNNYKIMEICLEIVMGLVRKRRVSDATYLFQRLRGAVEQSQLGSENPFHIRLSYLEALISCKKGQYREAESIIRLVIQKILSNQNLYRNHRMLSDALQLLGLSIRYKKEDSHSEIEKLYRYNIHQLSKQGRSLDMAYFQSMTDLIYTLLRGYRFEEAQSLCIYIMEYAELALGKSHIWYKRCQVALGRTLGERGMALESIEYIRNILPEANNRGVTSALCRNLGFILVKGRNFEEAIVMYKISLSIDVRMQGWCNFAILNRVCGKLGYCYEKLSQFQDALFLYENLLEKVKSVIEDDHPFIKKVEGWIFRAQKRMLKSSASSEDDGSGNTSSLRDVQMGGVDDGLGYGQFSDSIVDEVSLREIFEIEDMAFDRKIARMGKKIRSLNLSSST